MTNSQTEAAMNNSAGTQRVLSIWLETKKGYQKIYQELQSNENEIATRATEINSEKTIGASYSAGWLTKK